MTTISGSYQSKIRVVKIKRLLNAKLKLKMSQQLNWHLLLKASEQRIAKTEANFLEKFGLLTN